MKSAVQWGTTLLLVLTSTLRSSGGDVAPNGAGPSSTGPMGALSVAQIVSRYTDALTLSTAQATQTTTLVTQEQSAFTAARTAFETAFEASLTAVQLARYKAWGAQALGPFGSGSGGATAVSDALARLTQLLTLTSAQQTQTTTMLTLLQSADAAAAASFETAFEALLTKNQLAIYAVAELGGGEAPFGTGLDFIVNFEAYLTALLKPTATQQTQFTALVATLLSGVTSAQSALQTSVESVLTAAQLAIYEAKLGGGLESWDRYPPSGADQADVIAQIVQHLTSDLTLTSTQQTQISAFLTTEFSAEMTADTTFDTALEATLTSAQLAIYEKSLTHG